RRHLGTVGIHVPNIPILTNVTGDLYPAAPGSEEAIRDLLAQQVAAPVEYIDMVERMYALGARTFIEVGPKRAQQAFVQTILGEREHLALFTNHPKKGEIASFFEAIAQLWVAGAMDHEEIHIDAPVARAAMASASSASRADVLASMVDILCEKTGYDPAEIEADFELEADLGIDTVKQAEIMAAVREVYGFERDDNFKLAEYPSLNHLTDYVLGRVGTNAPVTAAPAVAPASVAEPMVVAPTATHVEVAAPTVRAGRAEILAKMTAILCEKTGYDPAEIEADFELEADLGIDTVKQAEIMAAVREVYGFERDDAFKLAEYPSLNHLTDYVIERVAGAPPVASPAPAVVVPPAAVKPSPTPTAPAIAADPNSTPVVAPPSSDTRDWVLMKMTAILSEKTYRPGRNRGGVRA
ncbi:MAG: phosphopantetheine-binding protein, partial [bacterium]